ncbi:hypothetical protein [Actinacidiphila sp. ITFR-21]|nr:hypothetical protein [Streptomyces sp. ITFR-21]WNI16281.1 hypothetical protein RLT57_12585 [Streptomyces sp. ITFR-21]
MLRGGDQGHTPGAHLAVEQDGNVTVVAPSGAPVRAAGTRR